MTALATSAPAAEPGGFFAFHGIWAPGVRLFRRLGFRAKAVITCAVLTWPLLAVVMGQSWQAYDADMAHRRQAVQHQVQVAHGLIAHLHAQEAAGRMPREQAQQLARDSLKALRYGNGEYFWINDLSQRMLMHPAKPELDGKDMSGTKDPNGFALFQAFVDTARNGKAGFVAYQWPKPGADKPVDKVSYVAGFEPWGWVVGTGIYVDDVKTQAWAQWRLQALLVLATVLLGGYAFHCFYLVMMGGLRETERHLRAMTDGDLTTSPRPWGQDEAARLMLSVHEMQTSLRGMVARVRQASTTIVHSSSEIAGGATDLQARTEQNAARLQQSAAAMEEVSTTVRTTADHVMQAAGLARGNAEVASRGGQVMAQMVQTMQEINAASSQIGDIIGTIDGIAFQTNILALNAAVEAARAGEQGRGFAVVAAEVRSLAQRSAQAAREIKALIGTSVDKVASGTQVVREAGDTIAEIVANAEKVDRLLGEIATGAREQSAGVTQIGQTVHDLDQATQKNAALVEQTAAASNAMREQAQILAVDVQRFRLPGAA
jgi:methyl-accepting chemotaxis protein